MEICQSSSGFLIFLKITESKARILKIILTIYCHNVFSECLKKSDLAMVIRHEFLIFFQLPTQTFSINGTNYVLFGFESR